MLYRILLITAIAAAAPSSLHAQISANVSPRAGTLGVGAEFGLRLGTSLGLRAGYSVIPVDYKTMYGGMEYTVGMSSPIINVGIDYFPGLGGIRFGGGIISLSNPTELDTKQFGTFEVGGQTYVGDVNIHGEIDHGSLAPYVIIGFGRPIGSGFGPFLDIGAALFSVPDLTLTATGTATQQPGFDQRLRAEEQEVEQQAGDYLRVWPIFSLGFRFGIL